MIKKLLLVFILLSAHNALLGQVKPKRSSALPKRSKSYLDKQVWLGFRAGVNLTKADVQKSYSILQSSLPSEKQYNDFSNPGTFVTLEATVYLNGLSISLQPTYYHTAFEYSNDFEWSGTSNPNNRLVLNYKQVQKLDHAELPLIFKYDILGNKLRPYVQAGVYYAMLINANKEVNVSGTDYASGGVNIFTNEPVLVGAEDLFAKNYWGLLAGVGLNYNIGSVRLILDANYRMGMSLANSTQGRFSNDRLNGIGDTIDDLKLRNMSFSFGVLFPMKYLASGFKTLD